MSKILAFLKRHPTKSTGFLLVVCGSLQANATALQAVISPASYAWFTVGIGCAVAALGFLNTARAKKQDPEG